MVVLTVGAGALGISIVVGHSPGPLIVILGLPVVLIGITGAVAFLYWFSVEGRVKVRLVLPGALTSSVGVVALIAGFGVYVAWSTRYTAVYGVFAGAVLGMVETYLAVYVILLGAVFNTQFRAAPQPRGS